MVTGTFGNCLRHNQTGGSPTPVLNGILFNNTCTFDAGGQAAVNAGTTVVTNLPATLTSIFVNGANEAGVTATNANSVNSFFTATTYIGAVRDSSDTWWQTWSCGLGTGSPAC
ncbi:MAG: hypothetical protein GC189_09355 [Alphaproteobacteria bacterium]|nr:hypothetical protein [Alphaproteobacteria bacterium]